MKVTARPEKVNQPVKSREAMTIVHSIRMEGPDLERVLFVDYLRGTGEPFVRISYPGLPEKKAKLWSYAAICSPDNTGLLAGFKKFAEDIVNDDLPVIALRRFITSHAPRDMQPSARRTIEQSVVHSETRRI